MEVNEISFENLPKAVAHLVSEIAEIKFLVERKEILPIPQKKIPSKWDFKILLDFYFFFKSIQKGDGKKSFKYIR